MELEFLLTQLSFRDGPHPLSFPAATVRVQPLMDGDFKPFIDVSFNFTGATPPGAPVQELAAYALQTARALVQPSAAVALLQLRLDEAARVQAELAEKHPLAFPPTPPT